MDTYGTCPNRRCTAAPKLLTGDALGRSRCGRCGTILVITTDAPGPDQAVTDG